MGVKLCQALDRGHGTAAAARPLFAGWLRIHAHMREENPTAARLQTFVEAAIDD